MTATTATSTTTPHANALPQVNPYFVSMQFVHEYYTIMHNDPGRLHCFYNKKSVLTHGVEGDSDVVFRYGQQEIHQQLVENGYENCQAIVSNVDYQPSADGSVLVMVIGKLSNKNLPARRFVQTFILAEQPNGYYILNDAFRLLAEEKEQEIVSPQEPVKEELEKETLIEKPEEPVLKEAPIKAVIVNEPESEPAKENDEQIVPEEYEKRDEVQVVAIAEKTEEPVTVVEKVETSVVAPSEPKSWAKLAADGSRNWRNSEVSTAKGTVTTVATPNHSHGRSYQEHRKSKKENYHNAQTPSVTLPQQQGQAQPPVPDDQHLFMVYIKGVPENASKEDFEGPLKAFGTIKSILVSRGFAVVEFSSIEEAAKAVGFSFNVKGATLITEVRRARVQSSGGYKSNYNGNRRGNKEGGNGRRSSVYRNYNKGSHSNKQQQPSNEAVPSEK